MWVLTAVVDPSFDLFLPPQSDKERNKEKGGSGEEDEAATHFANASIDEPVGR